MIVVLDFETTGLNPDECQVTEIAAIKLDAFLNRIGTFHTTVKLKEGQQLSAYNKQLTGLTEEVLEMGMSEFQAMTALKQFIGKSTVVAHYASFDLSFMSKWHKPKKFHCTRSMAQVLRPESPSGLADVTKYYGVSLEGHHRALNDVEATIQIFVSLLVEAEGKGIDTLNVMTNKPDRPLSYIPKVAKVLSYTQNGYA